MLISSKSIWNEVLKYFIITFNLAGTDGREMFFEVLKSLNHSITILPNVWITSGSGICKDAKSIFNLLARYVMQGDVIFVSQLASNVSMETFHGNISRKSLIDLISA